MPKYTRRQVSQALMGFGASQAQAEAFTGTPIARRAPTPREQPIVQAILAYLRLRRIPAVRINTQGVPLWKDGVQVGFRPAPSTGVPDIYATLPGGRACWIEVKSPTGRVSEAQTAFHVTHRAAGALVLVARSVDDVIAGLP